MVLLLVLLVVVVVLSCSYFLLNYDDSVHYTRVGLTNTSSIEMPVTDGPQVLEMLRADDDTKDIPVMFLTGRDDKESVMAVVSLKPEGYFLKTIGKDELLNKLKIYFMSKE